MNGASQEPCASLWTPPKKERLIELRQDYLQQALTYQFFLRARVSVSLVPRRSLLIRCFRKVSLTSRLMVESRNDRAENAWGLGSVSVLSWI